MGSERSSSAGEILLFDQLIAQHPDAARALGLVRDDAVA
jgi:hypothetical protein